MNAEGWAIIENGKIDIRSVSETRRGAIVNWIVSRKRVMIYDTESDVMIESKWGRLKGAAEVVEVIVVAVAGRA